MRSWECLARGVSVGRWSSVAGRRVKEFAVCVHGGMTIFVVVLFLMIFTAGGMAVDFIRHEAMRADLQYALDRGVLAATNLSRDVTTDAEATAIVRDYMQTRGWSDRSYNLQVDMTPIPGGREITASAQMTIDTIFLRATNLDTLNIPVTSMARQALTKLEVVLVLDVSHSMRENSTADPGSKIDLLKIAAEDFVSKVISASEPDKTLVTIVPYSSQVRWPAALAEVYGLDRAHDYASCFAFDELDFTTTSFPPVRIELLQGLPADDSMPGRELRTQYQHFIESLAGDISNGIPYANDVHGCPVANNAIFPFSNNVTALVDDIRALQSEKWTASYMGMKFAAALLNPEASPIIAAEIAAGRLPASFAGWPNAFTATDTRKIVILMTDGLNTRLHRIDDDEYAAEPLTYWDVTRPTNAQREIIINNNSNNDYPGDDLLDDICTALKTAPNVTIYTIGFEIADGGQADQALDDCASDPESTAFLVEGIDISNAFGNIAAQLGNLKLVQ